MTQMMRADSHYLFDGEEMSIPIWRKMRNTGAVLLCGIVLAGCAPDVPLQTPEQRAPSASLFPESFYLQAEARGKKILRVNAERSLLVFEVRRAGAFARLGHDHVVTSHDVKGFVLQEDGRADLSVPLDKLVVDEAALRAEAGFNPQPTQDDIDGTRRNMLGKVLEVARFPAALIHITRSAESVNLLNVSITLHGTTRTFAVPADIQATLDGIVVTGNMHFNQSDFGIVPFSILNGAIQVQDRLDMRFRIVAVAERS